MKHPSELNDVDMMNIAANVKSNLIVKHKFKESEINNWIKSNPKLVIAFIKETYKAVRAKLETSTEF